MLFVFNDKTVSFDRQFVRSIPEFLTLIEHYGMDALEAVAYFADYRSFYRHLKDKEKDMAIIEDWKKTHADSSFKLTPQKIAHPIFQKAIERYRQLNYDYTWHEYTVLEIEQKKAIDNYLTQEEEEQDSDIIKLIRDTLSETMDPDDVVRTIKGLYDWRRQRHETAKEVAMTRKVERENIENGRMQLNDLRTQLFGKTASNTNKMKLDAFIDRK